VSDPELDETKRALQAKELSLRNVGSKRPEWVMARLWEDLLSKSNDNLQALDTWLGLWHEIGYPHVVPNDMWSATVLERFHEAAVKLLASEPSAVWDEIIERLARENANIWEVDVNAAWSHFLSIPSTVIGRYVWLTSVRHERAFHPAMWPMQQLVSLASILMSDVERTGLIRPPDLLFGKVISIIELRPELMFFFILSLRTWTWATPTKVRATRVGPITRAARSRACFEKGCANRLARWAVLRGITTRILRNIGTSID
jgi:hypothetical protein